ncbi:RNA polymerase sigma factor [Pseudoflavitalea rhizosphaerae]|uniref:RNA polymerase sigma factor n=1 Tax=Pseudoflavitalea rhizosphaerae TaxID=1884793 RepID=UPI000F8CD470|nr:sigma-70 family RNA polymerase sigma factor [Pseudoflavitalea rhizosphaerae]
MLHTDNPKVATLIRGCLVNDRNSQKELYYLLRGFAMKICYRYTNAQEESEEIVNEGFVKLFKNIHQFDQQRQDDMLLSLKGWFKRILVNTCIDHYRKHHASVNGHLLTCESETIPDKSETGIDVLSYKEIIEAVRSLSPAYRTVFNLFVIEGMSHEEISKQLGISVGASKSNLSKARDNLRRLLLNKNHYNIYVSPQ